MGRAQDVSPGEVSRDMVNVSWLRGVGGGLAGIQLVEELCTLSTAIHGNSQKEKEAKRKRNGRRRLSSSLRTTTASDKTARKTATTLMKQQDISKRLNYRTFLNGLDKRKKILDKI